GNRVSFQVIVQTCEPEQNRVVGWPQFTSLFHQCECILQISGINKSFGLLDKFTRPALLLCILLRFLSQGGEPVQGETPVLLAPQSSISTGKVIVDFGFIAAETQRRLKFSESLRVAAQTIVPGT